MFYSSPPLQSIDQIAYRRVAEPLNSFSCRRVFLVLAILTAWSISLVQAQEYPYLYDSDPSLTDAQISSIDSDIYARLCCDGEETSNCMVIKRPDLDVFAEGSGRFKIVFPNGTEIPIIADKVSYTDSSIRVVGNAMSEFGTFILSYKNATNLMRFVYTGESGRLAYLEDTRQQTEEGSAVGILTHLNSYAQDCSNDSHPTDGNPIISDPDQISNSSGAAFICSSESTAACAVRVLHVFPTAARTLIDADFLVDIDFIVGIEFTEAMNSALRSSGISNKAVQSVVAFSDNLLSEAGEEAGEYLTEIRSEYLNQGSQLSQLATQSNADAIIYYSEYEDVRQNSADPIRAGIAFLGPQSQAINDLPLTWINTPTLLSQNGFINNYTAVHELGHQLGARHQREAKGGDLSDGYNGCNSGHVNDFNTSDDMRTVVATAGGQRQLLFSTPDVTLGNGAAGTADRNFNARWISNTFCSQSSVSTGGIEMFAAPRLEIVYEQGCARGIQLYANAFNAPSGVEYSWAVSRASPIFSLANLGTQFSNDSDPYYTIQGGGPYHFEIRLLDPTNGNEFRASVTVLVPDNVWCPPNDNQLVIQQGYSVRSVYDLSGRLLIRLEPSQDLQDVLPNLIQGPLLLEQDGATSFIFNQQ